MKMSHCAILLACVTSLALGIPSLAIGDQGAQSSPDLDPGQHQTGPAPCARLLWVGGYRGFGSSGNCPENQTGKKPKKKPGYTDKDHQLEQQHRREEQAAQRKADWEAKKAKQEQDRIDREAKKTAEEEKRRLEKERRDAEREARKAKDDRDKACRGLGLPAGCTLPNPGNGPQPGGKNQRPRR